MQLNKITIKQYKNNIHKLKFKDYIKIQMNLKIYQVNLRKNQKKWEYNIKDLIRILFQLFRKKNTIIIRKKKKYKQMT